MPSLSIGEGVSVVSYKVCTKCKIEKPKSEFSKEARAKDGLRYRCKKCCSITNRKRNQTLEGKLRTNKRNEAYRKTSKFKEWNKKYIVSAPVKERRKKYMASPKGISIQINSKLRQKYGITTEDYNALFKIQHDVCAICGASTPGGKFKRFCVDHDHKTNKIRGLLCNKCNMMLGCADDSISVLCKAIEYLTRYTNE